MKDAKELDPVLSTKVELYESVCGRYAIIRVDELSRYFLSEMACREADLRVDYMKRPLNMSRSEHLCRAAKGFLAEYLVRIAFYQEAKERYVPPPNIRDYSKGCLYDFAIRVDGGVDESIVHENGLVRIDVIAPNRDGGIGIRRKHVPPLPGRAHYQILTNFQTDGLAVLAVVEKDRALEAGAYFANPMDVLSLVDAGKALSLVEFMFRLRVIPLPWFDDLPL